MNLSSDWPYIQHIAAERLRNNKTSRHRADFGAEIEIMGAAGELAALRFLNLPEELGTQFDGGFDLILHGVTMDVKSTKPYAQYLQVAYYKRVRADIILMMGVDMRKQTAFPRGWAWRQHVLEAPIDITQIDACHRIHVNDLQSTEILIDACSEACATTASRQGQPSY